VLTTAVFKLVKQFYHATKTGIVANADSTCTDQQQPTKISRTISDKVTYCRT